MSRKISVDVDKFVKLGGNIIKAFPDKRFTLEEVQVLSGLITDLLQMGETKKEVENE